MLHLHFCCATIPPWRHDYGSNYTQTAGDQAVDPGSLQRAFASLAHCGRILPLPAPDRHPLPYLRHEPCMAGFFSVGSCIRLPVPPHVLVRSPFDPVLFLLLAAYFVCYALRLVAYLRGELVF